MSEKKEYFFIFSGEDGISIDNYSKEELKQVIKDEDYGPMVFKEELGNDINLWTKNTLIIKGEIIVPKPKTIVTDYEV